MNQTKISLPNKPKTVQEKDNSAIYEIEGLYPGYGHTLGNSLRRIILSSLEGAAVVEVKIPGVEHEFSTIEGVKEDVLSIILHIKKLRFKMIGDEPQTATLKVKGPKKVSASDFDLPGQLEILNPDEYIAEITGKTELNIEIKVEKGIGFIPKEELQKDRLETGVMVPDAVFSPIRRVNYEVENMRVEDRTDYNRLRIYIETDGSISPKEALENSIQIMIDQLKSIVGIEDSQNSENEVDKEEEDKKNSGVDGTEVLKILVSELELSSRTAGALEEAGIRTVGGLVRKKEEDLLALSGLGQKGLQEIKDSLKKLGLEIK